MKTSHRCDGTQLQPGYPYIAKVSRRKDHSEAITAAKRKKGQAVRFAK